jgi:hypothetical protein
VSVTLIPALSANIERKAETHVRSILLSFFLLSAAALASAADAPSFTGKWKVHHSIAGNEGDQTCTLTQSGKQITGACEGEQGKRDVTGKIDDADPAKITFQYEAEYNGDKLTVIHTGTLAADKKISGTIEVKEMSIFGDFTATVAE